MVASSLARTYYAAHFLPPLLAKRFSAIVLFWDGNQWLIFTKEGRIGNLKCTLRQSAALVSKLNLFISADSGFSHIAEALGVPSISLYSTVPSWTRVKYYKYTIPLEVDIPCRPCFTLQRYCPARQKQAIDSLSKREKRILWAQKTGVPIQVVAQELNTTVEGISREFASIKERLESQSMIQAKCLNLISIDEILLTAENILKGEFKAFQIKRPINVFIEGTKETKIKKIKKILSNEKVEIRFLNSIGEADPSYHLLILTEDVIPPQFFLERMAKRLETLNCDALVPQIRFCKVNEIEKVSEDFMSQIQNIPIEETKKVTLISSAVLRKLNQLSKKSIINHLHSIFEAKDIFIYDKKGGKI